MSTDWLDTDDTRIPALPIPVELPAGPGARVALAEQCWAALSDKQRVALTAFRENRLSARKMEAATGIGRRTHRGWVQGNINYATLVRLWMGVAGSEALDKDRLLARHDDIVEEAHEALLRAAGAFPKEGGDINVGVAFVPQQVEIEQSAGIIDVVAEEVEAGLVLPPEEDWLA